jgi:RNA recognition motif-containing protein
MILIKYIKRFDFNYRSLLVKNLSVKTTGFQLREIFSRYGFIRDVYIPTNHINGEKCNYAFIEIHPIVDIEKIIKDMSQFSVLNGRSMQVQIAISGRRSATEMEERYTTTPHYSTHRYYQTAERFRSL